MHLGKMNLWGKEVGYPKFLKRYPKCPVSISPNVCIWAPRQMGTRTFGGKGYLKCPDEVSQVPCAHFLRNFSNGQWGNFILSTKCPFTPSAYLPQCPFAYLHTFGDNGHKALGVPL